MLRQRLLTALIGLAVFIPILLSDRFIMSIVVIAGTIMSLFEVYSSFGFLKSKVLGALCFALSVLIVLAFGYDLHYRMIILYFSVMLLFTVLVINYRKVHLGEICIMFAVTFIISMFLSYIILIRKAELGKYLIWAAFLGPWATDSFAYFTGRLFGRRKLIPNVSPNKTVEGAIGGVIGCVVSYLVFGYVASFFGVVPNYGNLAILGILCGFSAQIGDLTASVMKREYGIKDFGTIMPGHGGMMDRIDSIIFSAPLIYYFVFYFPIITA